MPHHPDPLRLALQVGLYIFLYGVSLAIFIFFGIASLFGVFAESALCVLAAAVLTNILTLRIYEGRSLIDIGFHWSRASLVNLGWGLAGGAAAAAVVLASPILVHAATLHAGASDLANLRTFLFVTAILIFGAAGEEVLFRGYAFQVLLRTIGPFATILPVGVLLGALHSSNPHSTTLSVANTAGFGVLFGCAFLRSRDLWLPFGLHFGWNFTLPLFGATVSGIKIGTAGYELEWSAGPLWSGGQYGPEASVLTSGVLLALAVFVWKAPIRRQPNVLLDEPAEN